MLFKVICVVVIGAEFAMGVDEHGWVYGVAIALLCALLLRIAAVRGRYVPGE